MLYLHPPFYMYEGVPVVPDSTDPRQFYYFPNRPQLAVDEQDRPAIRFLIFREDLDEISEEEESAVGFLVFDTSLAWPEDTLEKVARKIQDDLELEDSPRLAPLLYKGGTVRLVFLDRATEPPREPSEDEQPSEEEEPEEAQEERWVSFLEASGVPSLYGENRAIFSAMLTKRATSLLFGAFDGFMPAGVIYDLTYVGLQDAFNVHVEADWEQAYHHISEKYSVDLVFVDINKQEIIDELEEKQIIKIKASLEGVGEEAMEAEFKAVREELQDFVLEKFFKPVVNPKQADIATSATDGIQTARRIINLIHHWPTAGYSRLELNTSEIRSLNIDYTVARAVERVIAPQAHLSLFLEDYNLTREQIVTVVDGEDALWKEVPFDIMVNADFDGDGIFSVATDLVYGEPVGAPQDDLPSTWSLLFDKNHVRDQKRAWYNPDVGRHFQYRYTIHFAPGGTPGPEQVLSSGWREHDGHSLVITPSELYQKRTVDVQITRDFPFDRYFQVHVHLKYEDPETGWTHEDAELLTQENPRMAFSFRIRRDASPDVAYRFTFLGGSGEKIETGWQTTPSDLITVEDPHPDKLIVRVLVGGERSSIETLIVDLKYEDEENNVREHQSFFITQGNLNGPHVWVVPLADLSKRRYYYSQTLLDTEGNMTQTGWIQDERSVLAVGDVFVKRWDVQPELIGPPLSDNGLERIKLNLQYHDASNNFTSEKQMIMSQPGRGEIWQLLLKDASARQYSYEVVYVTNTGFETKLGPLMSSDTFLVVSSVPPSA